jgi:hypothetical protein
MIEAATTCQLPFKVLDIPDADGRDLYGCDRAILRKCCKSDSPTRRQEGERQGGADLADGTAGEQDCKTIAKQQNLTQGKTA